MAITDKVIELSPVNKKKNIIFYVIMGVLLATTILFLLLFILKPAASAGEISGLELTSNLYKEGDGFIAAKGDADREYTLCAAVGYSGDESLDTSLEWILPAQFTRTNANEITESDMQEARKDATLAPGENTKVVYDYCKFKIDSNAISGNKATVTVRTNAKNKEDAAFQTKTIEIEVRDVGARELDFTKVTTQANTPPAALTQGDEEGIDAVLRLPYINRPTATSYTVYLEQIPEVDGTGREMPITVRLTNELSSNGSRYSTNAILAEIEGEAGAVNLAPLSETASNAFSFSVSSTGTAVVKVTGNKFNGSSEIIKRVKIIVNPIDGFDVVTNYKLMENAVDVNAENAPAGDGIDEIELLAGTGTGTNSYDLQSHIAVTPWRLQKSWAGKNVNIAITDEKGQAIGNTIVKSGSNGQGLTLEPLSPGTAYVTITDASANSIGANLRFKVNVRYDISRFGYGDRAAEEHSVEVITGSERNELEVTYLLSGKSEDVKPEQINAQIKVSGGKGIAFHDILKGTTDIIAATPKFIERTANGNVIMKATLYYDVKPDIGEEPVSFTLTPLGSTSDSKLIVTVAASVEATRVEFITEEEWLTLKASHIASDKLLEYASYSVDASGNAVLRLNMSNSPDYFTDFMLGDFVKFFDKNNNDASISGSKNVKVTLSEGYAQAFTLSGESLSPVSQIHPTFVRGDRFDNFNSASISFALKDTQRQLTIVATDTPLRLGYTGVTDKFTYGCPATDSSALRSIAVLPATVTQTYASGAVRSPSKYYLSIHINNMENELIQVDPLKYAGENISDIDLPYVYYFATEEAAQKFADCSGEITDPSSVTELRQEARRTAMFAVKRSYNSVPKDVHLLQDLYTTDYSAVGWEGGNKVNQIRFRLYPCDENGTPDLKYAADDYAVTPIRLIDEIVLSGSGISKDESGNGYSAQATSGSRFSVTIGAKLYIGTADMSAPSGSKVYDYNKDDANLADVQQITAECNNENITFSSTTNGHIFNMPLVQSGDEPEVVIRYTLNGKETQLRVTVHNRTLPVSDIELYADENMTDELTDGEHVLLNTLLDPVDYRKIYYKVTYDGTHLKDYISYETVAFKFASNSLLVDADDMFPNGNSIANNGEKTEFRGSITLHGEKTGTSEFYMQSDVAGKLSNKLHMLAYTPSSGIKMTDKATNEEFSSGDGRVDSVVMNIGSADDKPQKQWELKRYYEKANENIEAGGTTYVVSVKKNGSSELVSADGLEWHYDSGSRILRLASMGKAISSPVSLEVVITEYASHGDYSVELAKHIIEFTVGVTVSVYKTELTIGSNAFVTDGAGGAVEQKLGAVLNGGKVDHTPTDGSVTYRLYKNDVDISGDNTHAFRLESKSDGTYVVADNKVLSLDATYKISALSGGVESDKITLSLTTTAQHIEFTNSATVENGKTYISHNFGDTYDLSAEVRNSGTDAKEQSVSYAVLDASGNAFAPGSVPASVDAYGILSFNDVGSAEFKVVVSYGSLPSLTVNFVFENEVTGIKTTFDGHTSISGDITLSPVLFGGNSPTLAIGDVELLGVGSKKPYKGASYEVVWTVGNGVFTYDTATKTISFVGVGKASFTLRAETFMGSGVYVQRTFALEAIAPTFTASFEAGSDTQSVNIMDIATDKSFALTLSSSIQNATVAVTNVAVTSGGAAAALSLRAGAVEDSLFSYADGKLVMNYAAFADVDLSSVKTYEITVSATVNGVNAANPVKLYIRVSADMTYSSPQFSIYEFTGHDIGNNAEVEDEDNWQEVTGNTLKLNKSGKYTVMYDSAIDDPDFTVNGIALDKTKPFISFDKVGSLVVAASYEKYGKIFDIGTLTFFVTNEGSVITGDLDMFEAATDGKHYIDFNNDSDKKTVSYTIDWSAAGETFAASDFTLHYNANVLAEPACEYTPGSTTAVWTFKVNETGTTTIFASVTKNGAYYASEERSATFYVSARPTADEFAVQVSSASLDPTVSGSESTTITPTFTAPDNFVGDYEIEYAVVSGSDLVTLGALGADKEMPVAAKWTYGGGAARICVTLTVTSGYHKGTVLEKYTDIAVAGATEGTFTLDQPSSAVVLKNETGKNTYNIDANAEKGSGDESVSVSYEITSGGTYASVNATSGLVTASFASGDGGTVTVKVKATFARKSELGGGAYVKESYITVYTVPTALRSDNSDYKVTAGESASFAKPYVVIDGAKTAVTSVAYSVGSSDLGFVNGETFVSEVGEGGTVTGGVSVTASVTAGVFSVNDLTLSGGYTVRVLGIKAKGAAPTVTADGNVLEISSANIELSTGESVTGPVAALETDDADLLINSDDSSKLSVDLGTHRYFGDTVPDNISVKVKVRASGNSGTYVGYITVEIAPRKVEVTSEGYESEKSLRVGESFAVTYTIEEFGMPDSGITDVRMDAAHGACLATKKLEDNATKLVYAYTAREAASDTVVMKVEICGHIYEFGSIAVTVYEAPETPTFTSELTRDNLDNNKYTITNTVTGGVAEYSYSVLSGAEAIVGSGETSNGITAIDTDKAEFTVKHLKIDVDIVIEVTAVFSGADGNTTLKYRLEAIRVSAAPAPTFTSVASQDGTNDKLYHIVNNVENGTATYSYRIISGSEAVVGGSIASADTSFTVQECDEVTTVVIEVTATVATSYGTETMKVVLDPITVSAKVSSQVLTSTLSNTGNNYTISNTVSKGDATKYEYKVVSGSEAISDHGIVVNGDRATFTVDPLDKDVYVVIEVTATVKINAFKTETHKSTVGPIFVAAVLPEFTSSVSKDGAVPDKYNITNEVANLPDGATVEYSYRVLAGSAAIDGTLENNATDFSVKHLDYDAEIVIEVTATITESGKDPVVLKQVLEPVKVTAIVVTPEIPAPEFVSSFAVGTGSSANEYTITNELKNCPDDATVTYSYTVIAGSEAISGYTDAANNGITADSIDDSKAAFTAVPQSDDVVVYVKVTATVVPAAGGDVLSFSQYLEITVPAASI